MVRAIRVLRLMALASVLTVGIGLIGGAGASERTLTVCPQGPPTCEFTKIQEAIDASEEGDTILVKRSIYVENLEIAVRHNLTLRGEEGPVLTAADPALPTINLYAASDITIKGFALLGRKDLGVRDIGIQGLGLSGDIRIERNGFSQYGGRALLVHLESGRLNLDKNDFYDNRSSLWVVSREGKTELDITDNKIEKNAEGFGISLQVLGLASDAWVAGNIIHDNEGGIAYTGEGRLILWSNRIFQNRAQGVVLVQGGEIHVVQNEIFSNGWWGVTLGIKACHPDPQFQGPERFEGKVTGERNVIKDNGKQMPEDWKHAGDGVGDVCPKELESLKGK